MIALENVRLRFDSRGIAGISGIDMKLEEGTITALMGPNGSGKTTLLRILAGELSPDSGTVKCEEAVLFARPAKVTSEENVQKFLHRSVKTDIDEDKKLQLTRDLADVFEFTFQLRQKMGELSAGQRQKVLLAGELINNPRLILLDEPFAHLDPHTRKNILAALFEYVRRQKLTLLWVTHDLEEASRFSDRMILLQHGKIEQDGRPEEFFRSPRNIFVAEFVGFHNFIPVKRSGKVWSTPWGTQVFSQEVSGEEAILVIPDTSWELDGESPLQGKVVEVFFRNTLETLIVRSGDRLFTISGSGFGCKSGQSLGFTPRFSVCFLITL